MPAEGPSPCLKLWPFCKTVGRNCFRAYVLNSSARRRSDLGNHPLLSQLPPQCVKFLPRVGYLQSLALAKSADLLLNIDAPAATSVFLPSKLIDYIGAGRPIFGITPAGTAARLIQSLAAGLPTRPSPSKSPIN